MYTNCLLPLSMHASCNLMHHVAYHFRVINNSSYFLCKTCIFYDKIATILVRPTCNAYARAVTFAMMNYTIRKTFVPTFTSLPHLWIPLKLWLSLWITFNLTPVKLNHILGDNHLAKIQHLSRFCATTSTSHSKYYLQGPPKIFGFLQQSDGCHHSTITPTRPNGDTSAYNASLSIDVDGIILTEPG